MIDSMTSVRGRIGRLDLVVALVLSAASVAFMLDQSQNDTRDVAVLAAPTAVLVIAPLLWRRGDTLRALGAMILVFAGYSLAFAGGGMVTCFFTVPLLFLFAYAAGAYLERRDARIGLLLTFVFAGLICLTDGPEGADEATIVLFVPLASAIWGIGRLVRSRGALADELARQTAELRQARDERAQLEVATDRARMSAQLDELLQRHLTELAAMADAGAREEDPERATAALAGIEQAGRRTLEEMRQVVGVLRGGEAPRTPQPTLTHLDALLVRSKGAGAELAVEGSPRALPPGVELSAYRVVEHLLEALDDAPGVAVRVRFADDALELAVTGPAKRRRDEALRRAQERVRLHHGTLEATTRDGRGEAFASLPLYAGA